MSRRGLEPSTSLISLCWSPIPDRRCATESSGSAIRTAPSSHCALAIADPEHTIADPEHAFANPRDTVMRPRERNR